MATISKTEPEYDAEMLKIKADETCLLHSSKEKGFEYKKSIFATIFAIVLAMAIIFTILYTRCSTSYIKKESECLSCHSNALCINLSFNDKKCRCRHGFIGDGKKRCDSLAEQVNIPLEDYKLLPTAIIRFPSSAEISVCFRVKMRKFAINESVNLLQSFENEFGDGIKKNYFSVYMSYRGFSVHVKDSVLNIDTGIQPVNRSEHLCIMLNQTGFWQVYINGDQYSQGVGRQMRKLAKKNAPVYIGELASKKNSKVTLSELLVYSKVLLLNDIKDLASGRPSLKNLVINWYLVNRN